jgi:hypothetical protein
MNELSLFIKENIVSIAVIVSIVFALLIIFSIKEWDLNPPKPESVLIQEVTVEAFNSDEMMNEIKNMKLNSSDSFCQSHLGQSAKLEESCGQLTQDGCQETSCCLWTENNRCVAGDAKNGATYASLHGSV